MFYCTEHGYQFCISLSSVWIQPTIISLCPSHFFCLYYFIICVLWCWKTWVKLTLVWNYVEGPKETLYEGWKLQLTLSLWMVFFFKKTSPMCKRVCNHWENIVSPMLVQVLNYCFLHHAEKCFASCIYVIDCYCLYFIAMSYLWNRIGRGRCKHVIVLRCYKTTEKYSGTGSQTFTNRETSDLERDKNLYQISMHIVRYCFWIYDLMNLHRKLKILNSFQEIYNLTYM